MNANSSSNLLQPTWPSQRARAIRPTVSVVIPAYNAATSIRRALTSVVEQTVRPTEIIVVDDGSADATKSHVQSFGHQVRYVYQNNSGSSAARNHGLRIAKGEWIAFLDADDTWKHDKLARQLDLLSRHPQLAWISGGYANVQNGTEISLCKTPQVEVLLRDGVTDDALRILGAKWSIWTGTVMIRKDVFATVGGFDEAQRTSHDLDLWIRIGIDYPRMGWVREPIAVYEINNPVGLTKTSISTHDRSLLSLYERAIERSRLLPSERRDYIMQFATWHSTVLLRDVIHGGHHQQASWLLGNLKRMGVRVPLWLDLATRYTPPACIPMYRWLSTLRSRVRSMRSMYRFGSR